MSKIEVDSKSPRVRRYVRAVLARDKARLVLAAAEAQAKVALAELTGGQLGEASRLLKGMQGNGEGGGGT
jgi:hypothetical protein